MRFGNEKWWTTFISVWVFLLGIKLGSGDLLKAYHQSVKELLRMVLIAAEVSGLMTLIERIWLYRKKKEEQKPVGPPPVSAAEDWIPQYPDDNAK